MKMLFATLFFLLIVNNQDRPFICVNANKFIYGEEIPVNINNITKDTIYYYVDLEINIGEYWGSADPDIFQERKNNLPIMKKLAPNKNIKYVYNSNMLQKVYPVNYKNRSYRFALYYRYKDWKKNINKKTAEYSVNSKLFNIYLKGNK